jgi:hypothetical protein
VTHAKPASSAATTAALLALSLTAGAQALGPEEGPLVPLSPEAEHPETALAVLEQLARHHYVRRAIDDTLSSDTLDHYLDALDPQRAYFLEGDIAQFERYRYTLDDALRRGDLTPAFEIFNRYQAAAEEPARGPSCLLGQRHRDPRFQQRGIPRHGSERGALPRQC